MCEEKHAQSILNQISHLISESEPPAKVVLLNAFRDLINSLPINWEEINTDIPLTNKPVGLDENPLEILTEEDALLFGIVTKLDEESEVTSNGTKKSAIIEDGKIQITDLLGSKLRLKHQFFSHPFALGLRKSPDGNYVVIVA